MSNKDTILIICRNDLKKAPRFLMEINALKKKYGILAAGLSGDLSDNDYTFISLKNIKVKEFKITFHFSYPFLVRKAISFFLKIFLSKKMNSEKIKLNKEVRYFSKFDFNLIIVHHFNDLPMAVNLGKKKKVAVIFNAHEYYPLESDEDIQWMEEHHEKLMLIGKEYLKHVNFSFCVAANIARKYKNEFNLNSFIVSNTKQLYELEPNPMSINGTIKLIHHGAALRGRKIEQMINVMDYLGPDFTLDLVLVPGEILYIEELKVIASKYNNVKLITPVNVEDIPNLLNKYDVGIYILPPSNFNNFFALPNKFFEFIQARLALAIAPSPEMATIVQKYNLGVIADDFSPRALAEKIKSMSREDIMFYKNQSHKASKELSSEKNEETIYNAISDTLNGIKCVFLNPDPQDAINSSHNLSKPSI